MTKAQFISYVERSQEPLRRFLVALCCGNTFMADDIAQDTYLKAYLACDGFREDSKFSSWIHRIAYNNFLNYRRSQRIFAGIDEADSISAIEKTDGNFKYQALFMAMDKMPPKERSVILLYYMEGYSSKEIAEITRLSADAVRQMLSRGRRHLKDLLSSER